MSSLAVLLLSGCAGADSSDPSSAAADGADIDNCGVEVGGESPPERIFAMNPAAIENLIALGVEDRIVGAVGDLERMPEDVRAAAEDLDIIHPGGEDYPSSEAVFETEPDFIYSVYPSAFRQDGGVATREELQDLGVQSYLAPGRCPDRDEEQPLEFEEIWTELREVGALVGAEDEAEELVAGQQEALEAVRADLPGDVGDLDVFWWDMGTGEGPTAGGCCGAPGMILRELGVNNAFEDLPDHWSSTTWEQVVERDPDLVVIADFGGEDIDDKLSYVEGDATLRELRAFREGAVVELPFSQTTPGLQNVAAIETIGEHLSGSADR
ncbi:ABC transporter substrate-binding protein [Nocardiopsis salina]|uniref:ABC transporter substrate-binding protein n=1 Tax=Nocardiopsis salina TaxID=245836 RepID=UPI001EF9D500|nr:ABC transporter substrate-binding protein [Nocardiopsis salina]